MRASSAMLQPCYSLPVEKGTQAEGILFLKLSRSMRSFEILWAFKIQMPQPMQPFKLECAFRVNVFYNWGFLMAISKIGLLFYCKLVFNQGAGQQHHGGQLPPWKPTVSKTGLRFLLSEPSYANSEPVNMELLTLNAFHLLFLQTIRMTGY